MTAALRTLAFAELDADEAWGAAWIPGPAEETVLALGSRGGDVLAAAGGRLAVAGGRPSGEGGRPSGAEDAGEWQLAGAGAQFVAAPVGETSAVQAAEGGIAGWMQVCRVTGGFERDGAHRTVDCLGLRTWWSEAVELGRYESVRAVASWFGPDEALAVTAFRPRKARAHDRDLLAAAVIAPDVCAPVEDPRLSTTYAAEGWPVRAGLELWTAAGEEAERQYPHRASGEATGPRAQVRDGALELRAAPFRWHRRDRQGAGMYIVADRR